MNSVNDWRKQFSALDSGYGYFDNAGGSQTLTAVADRVRDYLLTSNVQHGASYAVSVTARDKVTAAINQWRKFFNAQHLHEIWFGASSTQLLANLGYAMHELVQSGDEIILTNSEHEANAGPWKRLAQARGATVKYWNVDPQTFRLNIADLKKLLTPRTKILAMCQVSNILGAINPVEEAVALAKAQGAYTVVDVVAYAAHQAVDVQALGCDVAVLSVYKIFGPHIAAMYVKESLHSSLRHVNHSHIPNTVVPYRFQPGGICYELVYGAAAVVDYLIAMGDKAASNDREKIRTAFAQFDAHENRLTAQFLEFLGKFSRVKVIGPDAHQRVSTVSFVVDDATPESICLAVDEHGIGIRHGHFHCVQLLKDLQLFDKGGVVRVSMAHYSTDEELQRLMHALTPVLR